jgi:NADPH-dependent glutamate synthase beta subunit-like oxidoreductase
VISARDFVAWYNGLPDAKNILPDLKTENVSILGQGNVAMDVARILLSSIDELKVSKYIYITNLLEDYHVRLLNRKPILRTMR